jgi:MFS family permease
MGASGYAVLTGVPVISTAWVNLGGFSEVEIGRRAGADLGGLSLGALVTSPLVVKFNRRLLVLISIAIAVAANALCMFTLNYDQVIWLRLMAGFGSGIYVCVAICSMGATSNPARTYNIWMFVTAFTLALQLQILPRLSMNEIYLVFIGSFLVTLPFLHWIRPLSIKLWMLK